MNYTNFIIFLLYINKKCINKQNSYAILQAHGFNNKQIINIELLDNIIIYTIGFGQRIDNSNGRFERNFSTHFNFSLYLNKV